MIRTFQALALLVLLVTTGCRSGMITNLTPTQYQRADTGVYTIEAEFVTGQQSVRHHTLTPSIVIGMDSYPMRRVVNTENRWEGTISVPKNQDTVNYHFKFDYDYSRFGAPGRDSQLSPQYELKIR